MVDPRDCLDEICGPVQCPLGNQSPWSCSEFLVLTTRGVRSEEVVSAISIPDMRHACCLCIQFSAIVATKVRAVMLQRLECADGCELEQQAQTSSLGKERTLGLA